MNDLRAISLAMIVIESVNLKNLVEGPRLYETTLIDAVDCIMES